MDTKTSQLSWYAEDIETLFVVLQFLTGPKTKEIVKPADVNDQDLRKWIVKYLPVAPSNGWYLGNE